MTRSMERPMKIAIAAAAVGLVLGFQNCGQFTVDPSFSGQFGSLGSTPSAGAVLVPNTDKTDTSCPSNSAYDACIIKQNPIAAGGTVLSNDTTARRAQVASQSFYGVKLTSLGGSGKLENSTLSVRSVNGMQADAVPTALKVAPGTAGSSSFEQANVYYWMNRAAEYFDARTKGSLPAKAKGIKVVVDDTITGYETATNTIRLKMTDSSQTVAWSGDIAVHLFGLANLMLANPNGWTTLAAAKHQTCNAIDKGCCATLSGCGNAIRFGVGEYFAASMFPDHTRIGDAIVNTGNPQIIAGVARDVASLSSNTASQIFTNSSGNAQAMGLLYAAIWWQVRAASGQSSAEIDRIFLEHLSLIDGSDDFRTAIAKAKTVDARLYGGSHSAQFDAQLTARGL
ncbi:hypothetical protein BH10BDE1_BH10BDE1_27070 [soil metagenome]